MKILNTPITHNGTLLAHCVYIPETILEKFMGLRGRQLKEHEAMMWYFKRMQLQLFDTFGCLHPIGYLAIDENKTVLQKGIMQPQRMKFIICSYWIEFLPDAINKVCIGDKIEVNLNGRSQDK